MILERDPAITRPEINETQMRMLEQCDIPGLLPIEIEEYDGQISLKYLLSGNRMLSEALRSESWSMYDMMGALCRLGEVLEECRLYLLDADRIRLHDEYIFKGKDWHDLSFTYVPVDMPTLHHVDDMERLIIRWMLKVKEPDGLVFQQVLRLVSTKGFIPIALSRYARQYLANSLEIGVSAPQVAKINLMLEPNANRHQKDEQTAESHSVSSSKSLRSWDIFRPTGDPHTVSELWGHEPLLSEEPLREKLHKLDKSSPNHAMPRPRWRTLLLCIGLIIMLTGWKILYLTEPTHQKLLFCSCLTLLTGAVIIFLWNKEPKMKQLIVEELQESVINEQRSAGPRFPKVQSAETNPSPEESISYTFPSSTGDDQDHPPETSWLAGTDDQTTILEHSPTFGKSSHYLVWENKESTNQRIPLEGPSLVIGRSSEVSQHVDPTVGLSRAHAELVKIAAEWKVKDLGSRNGSKLNDQPMAPYELYSLHTGDCLTLGHSQYRFHNEA